MDFHTSYKYICQLFLSVQVVWCLDEVTLLNPPDETLPDHLLKVLYSCDGPATVQLDCVVSFETGMVSTFLLREWSCDPSDPVIRTVKLNLPDWLVYQADGIIPDSDWVLSCILRASVRYSGLNDATVFTAAQDVAALQCTPLFSRPFKSHQLCFAWSRQMLQLTQHFWKRQCPFEQETVHLLSTIYASTGESFGITKVLEPYRNGLLEFLRLKAIPFPWCTISIWIFVTRHCQERMCGVFHHIDSHNNYVTPSLFLKSSGQLHIQISGEAEESSAFLSTFTVPLKEWCQLTFTLQGKTATVSMMCVNKKQNGVVFTEHVLHHTAMFDDTEGYFVIGGGKYVQGVEGYFGPVVYHRNKASPDSMPEVIPDVIEKVNLNGWLHKCQEFVSELTDKISGFSLQAKQGPESEVCFGVFHEWIVNERSSYSQCEQWEETAPVRKLAVKLAKLLVFKNGGRAVNVTAVGRALFSFSLHQLSRAVNSAVLSKILPLLLQAGCLADDRALHVASVLYSSGLGVHKQPVKALLFALLAAQKDNRLALLHLGHLHHQGVDGFPTDHDLAYAYYANIAQQTIVDRQNPTPQQTFVEAVYLTDDETLKLQTKEDHHIFQWLTLQAKRGAAEAQHTIARMLFWGQQGLSPNIQEAVKHYRRGAMQLEDPVSMYDYGIILLQGHGVEKDVQKGVTFLKKAMEQGFAPAFNALAWYYEQYEHNYEKAVQLWEQADLLESPDAALNLGAIYSQGLYPGKPANQYVAYSYYWKSANRGHIRGGILLASIWTTGIPGFVERRPSDAVLWVKWAAEHNGYLGSILHKALDSYLKGDLLSSLLFYVMAAESGYAPAQFNAAYLCEQNTGRFLDPADAADCESRYYNLTIQSPNPETYAFIRMGDLLYDGKQKDLFSAAQMYKLAALRNNPQGWYNLGLLVEEGHKLPLPVLIELGLSDLYFADKNVLLSSLYKKCRDSDDADSYLPCSLALFNVFLQSFHKDYAAAIKLVTAVAVVAAPTMCVIVLGVFRRRSNNRDS
ncbi:protein sel-1 homolog 3 isoform X2 [Austrofundulus limnaeus]|uniref:Protein sel-1 homolog 3 isoform X2 n=1 Tax=Austrofundulus limnaeus TaxID=52670 RepID=A0A2I4D7Q9_AUSLI|nr:PREDICTED: protein sel-1 homolog 3-like isoform X2 [Austrofundulus limnaeus]